MAGEFITIARVLGPQGRRGEVLAELHTDFPERFGERHKLWAYNTDGSRRELDLQDHWFHKGGVVLKFAGIDSISDAELLAGAEIQIPQEQRAELEIGAHYVSELVGCEVWVETADGPRLLGSIIDVEFGGGGAPLLVVRDERKPQAQEYLLPYAEQFLSSQDLHARRINVTLPDGLLELQTPLTAEERQRQKLEADEARAAGVKKKG